MGEVVSDTAAAFHELHLLLVDLDDAAVAVGIAVEAYHEAVAQRCHLIVVADACHGAALGHYVAEMVEKFGHALVLHRLGIFVLDAHDLVGQTTVHVGRSAFIDIAVGVFERIFADPYAGGKLIAAEIFKGGLIGLVVGVGVLFHCLRGLCFLGLQSYEIIE